MVDLLQSVALVALAWRAVAQWRAERAAAVAKVDRITRLRERLAAPAPEGETPGRAALRARLAARVG